MPGFNSSCEANSVATSSWRIVLFLMTSMDFLCILLQSLENYITTCVYEDLMLRNLPLKNAPPWIVSFWHFEFLNTRNSTKQHTKSAQQTIQTFMGNNKIQDQGLRSLLKPTMLRDVSYIRCRRRVAGKIAESHMDSMIKSNFRGDECL